MAPKRAAPASESNQPAAKRQKTAPTTPAAAAAPAAAKATPATPPAVPTTAASSTTPKVVAQVAEKKTAAANNSQTTGKKGKKGTKKVGSLRTKHKYVKKMGQKTGVVYVGHLPHGFYEYELRRYLTQYGAIKRMRVSRNPKTGRARGYAFVQFEDPKVAEKAANEVNGMYLSEKVLRASVMKPYLVDNHLWKGSDSNHLRILDARRRREGPALSAEPAGAAYVAPEKQKENSEATIKRHDKALQKSHIKYEFNAKVTL